MMRKIKKICNNKSALSYPMEAAISLTVIIFTVGIIVASISPSLEQSSVQKTIELKAQALEISSLLKLSGETQTGSPKWQVEVAFVKDIGLGLDPDETPADTSSVSISPEEYEEDSIPAGECDTNNPPNIPGVPQGETNAVKGFSYIYTASTTDPDGDKLVYQFNWNDGTGFSGWGLSSRSHTWNSIGSYGVTVRAKDPCGNVSDWSAPLIVIVNSSDDGSGPYNPWYPDDDDPNGPEYLGGQEAEGPCAGGAPMVWCPPNSLVGTSGHFACSCPTDSGATGQQQATGLTQTSQTTQTTNPAAGGTIDDMLPGGSQQASTCFLSGSQILMADGTTKNIEDLQIGDLIKSFDEKNQIITVDEVEEVFHDSPDQMITDHYLVLNNELKVTPDHLLYVNGQWIPAGDLNTGDLFADKAYVTSIEKIFERVPTYNMETKVYHTYLVKLNDDYVIAHNQNNYVVGGYDESVQDSSKARKATESDPLPMLSIYKINAMKTITHETMKQTFNLPDTVGITIIIKSLDGAETLLNYNAGISPYDAKYVASYEETVIVWDAQYQSGVPAIFTVVVSGV
jgi:hypothetical protein